MPGILKKSISCAVFCSLLLCCTGCEIEPADSPDTLEGILHIKPLQQETVPETQTTARTSASEETETEYQSIFFNFNSETEPPTETPTEPTTETATEEPATEPPTEPVTELIEPSEIYEIPASEWEQAYQFFLKNGDYQEQLSALTQEHDLKFSLLYLNDDDVPELALQTLSIVVLYTYQNQQVVYLDDFTTSHYTYEFYYRPYHSTIATMQGSVMMDGTYWEVREYTGSDFFLQQEYCYPTRESSYEVYASQGMYIDLGKAPALDIRPDRKNMLGNSWIAVPDVLELSPSISRYTITDEDLEMLFGTEETPEPTETTGV